MKTCKEVGRKINRLLILKQLGLDKNRCTLVESVCTCGRKYVCPVYWIRNELVKSCGCLKNEMLFERTFKHGHNGKIGHSPTYRSWRAMINRCTLSSNQQFKNYGGRGIKINKRWLGEKGFMNFLKDMGERPKNKTLDRINNNGDYRFDNCQWATARQQALNRRPKSQWC